MGEEKKPMGLSVMQLTVSALKFVCESTLPLVSCVDYRSPLHGECGAQGEGSGPHSAVQSP